MSDRTEQWLITGLAWAVIVLSALVVLVCLPLAPLMIPGMLRRRLRSAADTAGQPK